MKKEILYSLLFIFSCSIPQYISAQIPYDKIAYINSAELLEIVPGKAEAAGFINTLNQKYKEELEIMENDYNKKYSDFITWQNTMAESIKLRRMQELYELEKSIAEFIEIAQMDIEKHEQELLLPLKEKLKEAIEEVGKEQGYVCIYDLANPAVAFVTPSAIDANPLVRRKLTGR